MKREQTIFLIAVLCVVGAVGLARVTFFFWQEQHETLVLFVGESREVSGTIAADPDRRDTSLHVLVDVASVGGTPAQGRLLALLPRDTAVAYGDQVAVQGAVTLPEMFETTSGRVFDYPGYLRAQGVSAQMQRATLAHDTPGGFSIAGSFFSLKHAFEGSLRRLLPEPDESLLEGILLGEKHGIPADITNAFIASGLIHVVVLSGHNVSIVAEGVFRLLSFLPTSASYPIGACMMILFSIMTGMGSTTVRSLIMALIALLARYFHRTALALRSLGVAGVLLVLWNPEVLLHDPSFILSMLATFGLITLSPWVEAYLGRWRLFRHKRMHGARSIAATTIAVEIFVLPTLLYQTGVLSLLSVPANVLALPVVPTAMLAGFVAGLLGFLPGLLGQALALVPALLCDLLLKWMLLITTTVAAIPFGAITVPAFSFWIVAIIYLPLTWFALSKYTESHIEQSAG